MMGLLRWAEQPKEPVTSQIFGAARRGQLVRFTEDPKVPSYHSWGFLNISLVADA